MEIICSKCGFGVQGAKCSVCGTYAPAQKPAASQQQSSDVNIVKKATSFASSVTNYARSGFRNAPESIKKQRLEICGACDSYDKTNNKCNECGCYLSAKASWASESCPLGKWRQLTPPKNIPKTCGECNKKSQK
jgi:hypothetical protein